jgi:competence protein ComEC
MKQLKFFCCTLVLSICVPFLLFAQSNDFMIAHYIDVGQGQSILLEFPKGAVLIDAGAQDDMQDRVKFFLGQFFARRTDLNRTLNTVFITHQHVDHDLALQDVVHGFKVLNYVDNGAHNPHNSGKQQIWLEQHHSEFDIKYEPLTFDKITAGHNLKGLTDQLVDAVSGTTDPRIVVYSGAFATGEISASDMTNPNDHSLVIKVTYGKSSFLFTGDLEEGGIRAVLNYYGGTDQLKADVLQIGHHGAANGVTDGWLKAVKPHYAVISCGQWNFGMNADSTAQDWTTYAYAHPTKKAIDLLEQNIPDLRPVPRTAHIGLKGKDKHHPLNPPQFTVATVTHNVYVTAWDGNIAIKGTPDGQYSVVTDH